MFKSATVKLTLWYVLLAATLCLAYSVVVYHLSTEELDEALNRQYSSLISTDDHDNDNVPPPHAAIQEHSKHLLGELVWFNITVIAGSSVFGYFLARRTLRPIEQAHTAQIRFTAEASHELRTPLAAIRADTEVALMEKGLTAKARRTLEGNLQDIGRLEQLTTNLLDIARYHNGSAPKLGVLDFDELTRQAIKQLTHKADEKHITLKSTIKPVQVMGDQRTLEQLVIIFIDNAIKYSHENTTVTVSLKADMAHAVLTIKDKGVGIPADDLPHIFEYFYRSQNTSKTKHASGYGLGLPLAQEIIRAHRGQAKIESQENHGTTVTVTLPIAP